MNKKPTLFWFGDGAVNTGFGIVSHNILRGLHELDKYNIVQLGINYYGDPHNEPWPIYPMRKDPFGTDRFPHLLARHKPDILFTNNDIWAHWWLVPQLVRVRKATGAEIPWISYFPIDGEPLPNKWVDIIRFMDIPVCYTQWGVDRVHDVDPTIKCEQIYHGYDPKVFHPLPEITKMELKAEIQNKFVIGFVGRNQPRKQLPRLLEAFKAFSKGKDDVLLYLHTMPIDMGWELDDLVRQLELDDYVLFADMQSPAVGVPSVALNMAYNIMDLFMLPTVGEGFGLPIVEAMGVKVPVAVTDCSVIPEIVGDNAFLIDTEDTHYYMPNDGGLKRPLPSIEHMTEIMEMVYMNPEKGEEMGEKGYEHVQENYLWDYTIPKWEKLLDSLLPFSEEEELVLEEL